MQYSFIVSLSLTFTEKDEHSNVFDDLYLFQKHKEIKILNTNKYRKSENEVIYDIRISTDINQYSAVYDLVCDELIKVTPSLLSMGMEEYVSEFEFVIGYNQKISWYLSHKQLLRLSEIMFENPRISINSNDLDWKDEYVYHHQIEYYQLIFNSNKMDTHTNNIKKLWEKDFGGKYNSFLSWDTEPTKKEGFTKFVLSIENDLDKYQWDEVFKDLLNFIDTRQNYFYANEISISYGVYQHNRDSMNGGGIENELINGLVKLGLGLRVSLNQSPPFSNS